MRHSRVGRGGDRGRASTPRGGRLLGACLAAALATTGSLASTAAYASDEAPSVVEPTESAPVEPALVEPAPVEPAPEPAPEPSLEEPAPSPEPEPVDPALEPELVEPAPAESAPAESAPAEPAPAESAAEESAAQESAAAVAPESEPVTILVDTTGPGPDAGDVTNPRFRAAHPDTYTTANPGTADTSNVQTQLTSNTQNRFFECNDTIIYYQIIPIAADAPAGESTLTVTTTFDTRFGNNDQVGITQVTAFLAFDDSGYVSDDEETITGTTASGTWSDGEISLASTVTDIEAGETIVVEYHATLTCGIPPGTITGNLHAINEEIVVSQNAGAGPTSTAGGGAQTVPLFANAVLVTTVPVNPTVTQAACPAGELIAPTLTLPPNANGITYTVSAPGPYAPGQTVTVTATLSAGFTWGTLPAGWVEVSPTVATFTVTFDNVECKKAVPVNPTITQAACPAGVLIAPTLTLPPNANGITYTVSAPGPYAPGQTVTVTATLAAGFTWGTLPAGWVQVSPTVATFTVTFFDVKCKEAVPVNPTVTQAACPAGVLIAPTLTLPPNANGITYTVSAPGPYAPGQTVTVTATLAAGFIWGTLPAGWVQVSPTVATFTVTFDNVKCEKAVPVNPTITQAECPAGVLIAPTLTLPPNTTGITYTVNPAGPYAPGQTVTVTATLSAGFAWGTLPAGWVEVSPTVATFTVTFFDVKCKEAVPVNPTVTQAACPAGVLIAPTLVLATTQGITYTVNVAGPYAPGQTVVVTATLAEGFAWGDLPAGWTEVSPTVATFPVTFANVACVLVSPQTPTITASVCPPGATVPTPQVLTVGATQGITYTANPVGPYSAGQTVTITATLHAGFAWGTMPAGWTIQSPTTATFKATFGADAICPTQPPKAAPAAPPKPAAPAAPAAPRGPLPVTGTEGVGALSGLAVLSLLAGLALANWARRRGQLD